MQTITASSISKKTISGIGWSTASKFFRQFVQLFFQIVLARLLSPADFGIIGMIMVFTSFAEIIRNLGLGAAIIQKQDSTTAHYNAAFWGNVMLGVFLNILLQVAAGSISSFYKLPQLENIIRVYSFIFLIGSLNIVQEALLQKNLEFKRLFMMDAIAVSISGIAALLMAYAGWGVWTLVYQYLIICIVSTIILWFTSSWKPQFSFKIKPFRELQHYGFNFMGHELLNFVSRNIDNLLIGKYIGAAALGFYSRAYFLMLQPVNITNQVLARVMFPVLSRLQNNIAEVKRIYLKSTGMIAFAIFPMITYIIVMAEPIIILLLGTKWLLVAPLLQIFCIYCMVDTIGITAGWIYKSLGRTDILFKWAIYSTIIYVTAISIGLQWGITGVAWSYTIAFLIFLWIPGWILAFRLINLSLSEMFRNILPAFFCSLLAGIVSFLLHNWLKLYLSVLLESSIVLIVLLFVYYQLSKWLNRATVSYAITMVRPYYKKLIRR